MGTVLLCVASMVRRPAFLVVILAAPASVGYPKVGQVAGICSSVKASVRVNP